MDNGLMNVDSRFEMLLKASENTLGAVQVLRTEITTISDRMDKVEKQLDRYTTITSAQAKTLRRAANKRVKELLPDESDYLTLRVHYYSWLWNRYQDAFNITSYLDTPLKFFEVGLAFIQDWQPIQPLPLKVIDG